MSRKKWGTSVMDHPSHNMVKAFNSVGMSGIAKLATITIYYKFSLKPVE
jgi:hypothetical protein